MKKNGDKEQSPAEFAKSHWKEILAASGTLAGAVIFLLIRYHQKRKKDAGEPENKYLDILADDARGSRDEVPLMLEMMSDVNREIPDAASLTEQLAKGLPKGGPRENMQTIGQIK